MTILKRRKVYIRVKDGVGMPGAENVNTITRRLSSVWTKNQKILNPLSEEECRAWIPMLTNIEAADLKFRDAVTDYFANITVPISLNEAYELEVGMEYDTEEDFRTEKVSYDKKTGVMTGTLKGKPIDVANYVLYRFALMHPKVANEIEFLHSSGNIWFYLEDLGAKKLQQEKAVADKMKANALYFTTVAQDVNLQNGIINTFLDVMTLDKLVEDLTEAERIVVISGIMDKYPNRFITVAGDPNLSLKSMIQLALYKNILSRIPNTNTITFQTNTELATIGNGMDEAVNFMKHEKNAVIRNTIEVKLKALK